MTLSKSTEWEGEHIRLVKLTGLPSHGSYRQIPKRTIRHVICHQSAGNSINGEDAAIRIAAFHSGAPKYKLKENGEIQYRKVRGKLRKHWIGGGRGWPGIAYQFVVPTIPDVIDGKMEVYRTHNDETRSYHTGGTFNTYGVGVVVAGMYRSRHSHSTSSKIRDKPDDTAAMALRELVLDYLLPRYELAPGDENALMGHFDAGKAACPGDFIEQWVRSMRGEGVPDPMEGLITLAGPPEGVELDIRELQSDAQKQDAIKELGLDIVVDDNWAEFSRMALAAFQEMFHIVPDGIWASITERVIRAALKGWVPPNT